MDSDLHDQWTALTASCGIFPAAHRRFVKVTGDDRAIFLQGMLTNDMRTLPVGGGLQAAHLDRNGKLIVNLNVYANQAEILLEVPSERALVLRESLERFIVADDVELSEPPEQPLVGIEGPDAACVVAKVFGDSPPSGRLEHGSFDLDGTALRIVCASEFERTGFLVCGPSTATDSLHTQLCAAGAIPVTDAAVDLVRIEAGVPRFGIDMTEDNLVMEVGLADAISFKKGCYLGQEVVERVAARGHVNRRLCGLLLDGELVPPPGTRLVAGDKDGGFITSAVRSFALNRVIALGYVQRAFWETGTELDAQGVRAVVSTLPFVAPSSP